MVQIRVQSDTQVGLNLKWLDNPPGAGFVMMATRGGIGRCFDKCPLQSLPEAPGPLGIRSQGQLECVLNSITTYPDQCSQQTQRKPSFLSQLVHSYYLLSRTFLGQAPELGPAVSGASLPAEASHPLRASVPGPYPWLGGEFT